MTADEVSNEPQNMDLLPTREGYDRWAVIYDDEDNPLIRLEEPQVTTLLGDVRGLDVLDLGCGTGRWTARLATAGAHVTALDFSAGMLARAREKVPANAAVRFVEHDIARLLPLANAAFHRVLCALVLDHVRAPDRLFREMARVCRPEGCIVISVMHPAMMLRGITARFTDPETGRETRPQSAANQVSDYVMAAVGAGLHIDHLAEHAVDEALAAASPRAVKYVGWPLLLSMRLRRPQSAANPGEIA